MEDRIAFEARYGAHNYHPLPIMLARGQGVWLWDIEGKRYLDLMSAYSAVSHGHTHPRLVAALIEQAGKLAITSRAFYSDKLGPFLAKLCEVSGLDRALPMNTGAEAVETAIKAVRRWGYRIKKIPKDCAEIIVVSGNFHGRTTTIISFSSADSYKDGFGPLTPGFVTVPYRRCGGAGGGDHAPYLRRAAGADPGRGRHCRCRPKAICACRTRRRATGKTVLLIVDEIQSGLGRTGKMFCFQQEGIVPDGITVGKALGGGIAAGFGLSSRRQEVMDSFVPGNHGSTFGGNPLAAAVGLEALQVLEDEHLVERSDGAGGLPAEAELSRIQSPAIKEVRGKGLWVGLELDPAYVQARVQWPRPCWSAASWRRKRMRRCCASPRR